MAITTTWDRTDPANSDDPRNGAQEIRDLKFQLYERLTQGGIFVENPSGSNANAGKIAAGVQAANVLTLYETDLTTAMMAFNDSTEEVVIGDGVGGSNSYTLKVDAIETATFAATGLTADTITLDGVAVSTTRQSTLSIGLPALATGRIEGVIFENRGPNTLTILEARLVTFNLVLANPYDLDINILTTPYTDPNAAGTSIFAANPHPTIPVGNYVGAVVSTFNDPDLAVGEAWVFDIDGTLPGTGSGNRDLALILKVERLGA